MRIGRYVLYVLYVHNSGPLASPAVIRDLATEAERCGYDGCWTNELWEGKTPY